MTYPPPTPFPRHHYIYRAYDYQCVLLYLGVAVDPWKRLRFHRSTAEWYRWAVRIVIDVGVDDRCAAEKIERAAIEVERPV